MRALIKALPLLAAAALCCAQVQGAQLKSARSFANTDKTRVVFDLSGKISWKGTTLKDGRFELKLNDLDNARKAPAVPSPGKSSCLKSVKAKASGKQAVYTFDSSRCGAPHAFLLSPRDGNPDWRLVADFAHSGVSEAGKADSGKTVRRADAPAGSPDDSQTLKDLEQRLFLQYSTPGSDGLRSMTPAQATAYDKAVRQLRADFAREQDETPSEAAGKNDQETVHDTAAPPKAVEVAAVARPFVIAIDPGHGGKDPGAISRRGVREKNVALAISKSLVQYINSDPRLRAVLTRSSDRFVSLDARSAIARRHKADLLISVHCNSTPGSTTARGLSVLLLSSNRAQRENGKILRDGGSGSLIGGAGRVIKESGSSGNHYLEATVLDMSSQNTRAEGYDLASAIIRSVGRFTRVYKSRPIYASLAVLKAPDIPSLLIETGFLSNRSEEVQLNQPNYQKQMAYRIFKGIQDYYEQNPLKNLQSRRESAQRSAQSGQYETVKVKKGEYLSLIAARHGTTVAELKRLNGLKSDTVVPGQKLKVPK